MKVGNYARTDKGEIGKLKELKLDYTTGKRLVTYYTYREVKENLVMFDNAKITQRFVDGSSLYLTDDELKEVEDSIIKSSPNIIDLIEVGDYVNGYRVAEIETLSTKQKLVVVGYGYDADEISENNINSIVTREMFESMEYKVGDE